MSCSFHFMGEFGRTLALARDTVRILHSLRVPCLSFYRQNLKCHCYQWPSWFRRSPQGAPNYTFCQQKCLYCSLSEQKCPTRKCHTKEFWSFAATTTSYIWPVHQLFIDRHTHSWSFLDTLTYIAFLAFPYLPLCQTRSLGMTWHF